MKSFSNKATHAIIMAAGKGERLLPLTERTPKPLIKVNGKEIICSEIDGLHQNGISEIYIVVGYLKDQFSFLTDLYPGIVLLENPYYEDCNNISSLYVAKDFIENSIILDGDLIINNPKVLRAEFDLSGYNAVWCENQTDEWIMQTKDGIVVSCSCDGGCNGWQLYSISRWSAVDGIRLKKQIVEEFEKGNTGIYWDNVVMQYHLKEYKLGIFEMQEFDVVEIDTIDELKKIDNSYK